MAEGYVLLLTCVKEEVGVMLNGLVQEDCTGEGTDPDLKGEQ